MSTILGYWDDLYGYNWQGCTIVSDGLKNCDNLITRVHNTVKYVRSSLAWIEKFESV